MAEKENIYDYTHDGMVLRIRELGGKAYRARQILNWLYQHRADDFESMTNLPARFRKKLSERFSMSLPVVTGEETSEDSSRKFQLQLGDGEMVEAVLIPTEDHTTLCISSQVGCKFACAFCRTGTMGFKRNLTPGEIVGQLLTVERQTGTAVDNIVLMGMGEPLDNLENLLKALDLFTHFEALGMSQRRITISTAGIPDAIRILKTAFPRVGLSVSINAPSTELRAKLMPIEEKYPIGELVKVLKEVNTGPQDAVTIEYVLLEGVNSSLEDATKLCRLLEEIPHVKVNLIPYNPSHGLKFSRPKAETVEFFQSTIKKRGYECFVRKSAGRDISAACGQLAIERKK